MPFFYRRFLTRKNSCKQRGRSETRQRTTQNRNAKSDARRTKSAPPGAEKLPLVNIIPKEKFYPKYNSKAQRTLDLPLKFYALIDVEPTPKPFTTPR